MEHPEVKHLYKYYAYNENSLSVLINKKVWVPKPESFNDPFDCDSDFNPYAEEKALEALSRKTILTIDDLNDVFAEGIRNAKEKFTNSGIFTMSAVNDSILMWSHYADKHKGFCIGFDRKSNNALGKDERTKRIEYEDDYPEVHLLDSNGKMNEYIFVDMFFTKFKGWNYEAEWRIKCDEGNTYMSLPSVISSITFGLKMSGHHKRTILNILAGQSGIKFRQAEKVEHQFKINIIDLPK